LRRLFYLALAAIILLGIAVLLLMHEEPFARGPFCAYTGICPQSPNAKAWNKIGYDLAVAALMSSVFYFLVVWIPERDRRRRREGPAYPNGDFS
jgi:hypothetical protein